MMRSKLKKIIPESLMPLARMINWRIFDRAAGFSKAQFASLSSLKCMVVYNKYGGYCIPLSSSHRPAAQTIRLHRVYEPQTIDFIVNHCGSGDIVHAGAYFGDFFPALSKGVAADAWVWAFEPNLENFRCATITLAINDIRNIILTHAGLGAREDMLYIQTADEHGLALGGGSRIVGDESGTDGQVEPVQIVTIDGVVGEDRSVSIIHLDVEGYEKEALMGALKTIQRCHPYIILEDLILKTLHNEAWFQDNISYLGYRKIGDLHWNSVYACQST